MGHLDLYRLHSLAKVIFSKGVAEWLKSGLTELVDMHLKTAAEVAGLILRNDVFTAEALKKLAYLVVGGLGFSLVCHLAHAANSSTGCFGPVAVLKTTLFCLAYSF